MDNTKLIAEDELYEEIVTAAEVVEGSAYTFWDQKEVKLDRPFIFAIMHNETRLPVFVGTVNQL